MKHLSIMSFCCFITMALHPGTSVCTYCIRATNTERIPHGWLGGSVLGLGYLRFCGCNALHLAFELSLCPGITGVWGTILLLQHDEDYGKKVYL